MTCVCKLTWKTIKKSKNAKTCLKHRGYSNYTPLHSTTLNYIPVHSTTLNYITIHYTTLHSTTLHHTILHYTTLPSTTLHYITLHYTAFHYATRRHITLHYAKLHSTTLAVQIYMLDQKNAADNLKTSNSWSKQYVNPMYYSLYCEAPACTVTAGSCCILRGRLSMHRATRTCDLWTIPA